MTQEEKELSFIDISGRLHYDVIVNYKENEYDCRKWKITSLYALSYGRNGTLIDTDFDGWISYKEYEGCGMSTGSRPFRFGEVLPYLRPMSSMTEEEEKEVSTLLNYEFYIDDDYALAAEDDRHRIRLDLMQVYIDWLNAHHFDYRNLIEKGLALEALEGMYD